MNTSALLPVSQNPDHLSGVTPLQGYLGVIRASGAEAASFLQGQLTQDVLQIASDEARLAAFCSAKGRMQASFTVFREGAGSGDSASTGDLLLVCSADLLAPTLKRLSMFVLRSKVRLSDASGEFVLCGLSGTAVQHWLADSQFATKTIAARAGIHWAKATFDTKNGAGNGVFLPSSADCERVLWCAPAGTPLPAGATLKLDTWRWLEVQSGIAMVTQPIADAFVPQMLNYESVGGVNFKKGCYPGQEIVARSQFRGTIKRRTVIAYQPALESGTNPDAMPFVGQEVFCSADNEQPCGTVVAAAPSQHPDINGFDLLICLPVKVAEDSMEEESHIYLAQPNGDAPANRDAALHIMTLPYRLLDDI